MARIEFFTRRGFAAIACQGLGLGLVFLAQIALARTLGAESYGILAYVNAWLLALGIAARFGLDTVVLRDAGIHVASNDTSALYGLVRRANMSVFGAGVTLGLILAGVSHLWIPATQAELKMTFLVGALWLPLQGLSSIRASVLLAFGRVWAGLSPDYLIRPGVLGGSVLVAGLLAIRNDAIAGMSFVIFSAVVALLVGQVALSKSLPPRPAVIATPNTRQFLGSAISLLIFNGSSQLLYQIDTIVVGSIIDPQTAGTYYAAKQLALVASLAIIALQWTSSPSFAALWAERRMEHLQALLRKVALQGVAFSVAYIVLCGLFGKYALALFGAEFKDAYPVLMVLAIGQLCAAVGGPVGQFAAMAGLQVVGGAIYIASTVALAVMAPFAIAHGGVLGAALAAVVVTCAWVIAFNVLVWRRLGVVPALIPVRWFARD